MARTTHRFTQLSEGKEQKHFLFSIRKEKEIRPHGKKSSHNLTIFEWYLLPAAYYIYHYSRTAKEWQFALVVIKKSRSSMNNTVSCTEEYKPVNSPPEWLTEQINKTVQKESQ